MATVRLAPSILAADFARLGEQVREAEAAGATILVAGTAMFRQEDGVAAAMQRLVRSCGEVTGRPREDVTGRRATGGTVSESWPVISGDQDGPHPVRGGRRPPGAKE